MTHWSILLLIVTPVFDNVYRLLLLVVVEHYNITIIGFGDANLRLERGSIAGQMTLFFSCSPLMIVGALWLISRARTNITVEAHLSGQSIKYNIIIIVG